MHDAALMGPKYWFYRTFSAGLTPPHSQTFHVWLCSFSGFTAKNTLSKAEGNLKSRPAYSGLLLQLNLLEYPRRTHSAAYAHRHHSVTRIPAFHFLKDRCG